MRQILCVLAVLACLAAIVPEADAFHRFRRRSVVNVNVGGFRGVNVAVANRGFFGRRNVVNVNAFGVQPAFVRSRVLVQPSFVQPTFVQPALFGGGVTVQSGGCGALFIR